VPGRGEEKKNGKKAHASNESGEGKMGMIA